LITFTADWRPIVLENPARSIDEFYDQSSCLQTLAPFIEQNAFGAIFEIRSGATTGANAAI
jgi:hypothetical protein